MVNKSNSSSRTPSINKIISEIRGKSKQGDCIYRGEREDYPKISSALYRECAKIDVKEFDLTHAQKEMLKIAKNHIGESPVGAFEYFADVTNERRRKLQLDWEKSMTETIKEVAEREILTELQHYGAKTNLIDFTTDYLIGLFFACTGDPKENGRVILLQRTEKIEEMIIRPRNPRHRVIAQKSVFLHPPKGFIERHEVDIVVIPVSRKKSMLNHLRKYHDISAETIYNDIHGFIRIQNIQQNAYIEFFMGRTYQERGNKGIFDGERIREYKTAIRHYSLAIEQNPELGTAYNKRGECSLHLGQWRNSSRDLTKARDMGSDLFISFHSDYSSIEKVEKRIGRKVPPDLADMIND